jgi:hypothetical protein
VSFAIGKWRMRINYLVTLDAMPLCVCHLNNGRCIRIIGFREHSCLKARADCLEERTDSTSCIFAGAWGRIAFFPFKLKSSIAVRKVADPKEGNLLVLPLRSARNARRRFWLVSNTISDWQDGTTRRNIDSPTDSVRFMKSSDNFPLYRG